MVDDFTEKINKEWFKKEVQFLTTLGMFEKSDYEPQGPAFNVD